MLNSLRAETNELARKADNYGTQDLLHGLENIIVETMVGGDVPTASKIAKAKEQYKNLLVLEPLVKEAKGGFISPSALNRRVASVYQRQYARGQAGEIGSLARIGYELLPELGGSDTAQKLLYIGGAGGLLGGAGLVDPVSTAAATATGVAGNRLYQSGINRNQRLIDKKLSDIISGETIDPSIQKNIDRRINQLGDRIPEDIVRPPEPLALPPPQRPIITNRQGVSRAMTDEEMILAEAGRKMDLELGMSPDIRKAIGDRLMDSAYADLDATRKAIIDQQIREAWAANRGAPLEKLINDARANAQKLAEEMGELYTETTMGRALREAKPTLKSKIKKENK